jgi:hypothetical protein
MAYRFAGTAAPSLTNRNDLDIFNHFRDEAAEGVVVEEYGKIE